MSTLKKQKVLQGSGDGKLCQYVIIINDHVNPTIYTAVLRSDYLAFMNGERVKSHKSENILTLLGYINQVESKRMKSKG